MLNIIKIILLSGFYRFPLESANIWHLSSLWVNLTFSRLTLKFCQNGSRSGSLNCGTTDIMGHIILGCGGGGGAVLWIAGCLAVFLVIYHQMPVAPPNSDNTELSPDIVKCPLRGQNHCWSRVAFQVWFSSISNV